MFDVELVSGAGTAIAVYPTVDRGRGGRGEGEGRWREGGREREIDFHNFSKDKKGKKIENVQKASKLTSWEV